LLLAVVVVVVVPVSLAQTEQRVHLLVVQHWAQVAAQLAILILVLLRLLAEPADQ
jgi:hypothetical protein